MSTRTLQHIQELRELPQGWYGPGSLPPDPRLLDDLESIADFLESYSDRYFAPLDDGQIHFEWETTEDGVKRYYALEYSSTEIWYCTWRTDYKNTDQEPEEETVPYSVEVLQQYLRQGGE